MTPQEEKQMEWLRGDAHIAHEAHRKTMADHLGLVGGFSNAAMRAPGIAAAGAIAALLGFFSANYRVISGTVGLIYFNQSLLWFAFSVLLTVLAPGLAYFAQYAFLWALGEHKFNWERPFIAETSVSKRYQAIGNVFQVLAIIAVLGSIALLVFGGLRFLKLAVFVSQQGAVIQYPLPL